MARHPNEVYEPRFARSKDKVRALEASLVLARLETGRLMTEALAAGVKRTTMASWWNTSTQQVDRMMLRARVEK